MLLIGARDRANKAIAELNKLKSDDFEHDHLQADEILLTLLVAIDLGDVATAFNRASKRCKFQYA